MIGPVSMSRKGSRRRSSDIRPSSWQEYVDAHRRVFGRPVMPKKDVYIQAFFELDVQLLEMGVSSKEYAITVVTMLERWARAKGWRSIPVNVFCGKMAMERFLQVQQSKYVRIRPDKEEDELFHSELVAARYFVHKNIQNGTLVRFGDAVEEIAPMLSERWLKLYKGEGEGRRPVPEVLEILEKEYNLTSPATSYWDIVHHVHGSV